MSNRIECNIGVTDQKLLNFISNGDRDSSQEKFYTIFDYIYPYICRYTAPKILDIGCRGGYFFDVLYNKGYKKLYGVDISQFSIDTLCRKGYDGCVLDIQEEYLNMKFDIVFLIHVLEHTSEPGEVIDNVHNMLIEGGLLYIEVPRREKGQNDNDPSHFVRFESFDMLDKNFSKKKWVNLSNDDSKPIRAIYRKVK